MATDARLKSLFILPAVTLSALIAIGGGVMALTGGHERAAWLGATLLISPQSVQKTRQLATRFDLPIRLIVDTGNTVAKELGIVQKNGVPVGTPGGYDGETVMPTLIATNAAGTIVFSDQTDNYRGRPEPDIFIAILIRAGAMAA